MPVFSMSKASEAALQRQGLHQIEDLRQHTLQHLCREVVGHVVQILHMSKLTQCHQSLR